MGYLLSAFLWAYAFAQLPTGAMVDKLGPRLLLTFGLGALVVRPVPRRTCPNFGQFSAPGSSWASARRRNFRPAREWSGIGSIRATADLRPASSIAPRPLGTAIAVPVLTFLMLSFGWRTMFMIMGAAGLGMAAIWYLAYRNPTDVALTAEETVYRTEGDPAGQRTKVKLQGMAAIVRLPDHLGDDPRLFRLHLSDLDLHRVAARLSRDRAAHERQVHRRSPRPSPSPGAS